MSVGLERAHNLDKAMSALLAILATRPLSFVGCLSPANLAVLSRRGLRDGWGAATYASHGLWTIERREGSSAGHELLVALNTSTPDGVALVGHVHPRILGAKMPTTTCPLRRGRWVFAHAGVVDDVPFLKSRTSRERREQYQQAGEGEDKDRDINSSAVLFAFLLTRLDERGAADRVAPDQVDHAMAAAALELASCHIGSSTFVLSDGNTLYAHRFGRPLYALQRRGSSSTRTMSPATTLVASEPLTTNESWSALEDGSLVRYRRSNGDDDVAVEMELLAGSIARESVSDIELPFTD